MNPSDPHATPVLITLSTIPEPAPCCQRAHERGYRHGYRHGYVYALWDLGRSVRLPDALWAQITSWLSQTLTPWAQRADGQEPAPRFRRGKGVKHTTSTL